MRFFYVPGVKRFIGFAALGSFLLSLILQILSPEFFLKELAAYDLIRRSLGYTLPYYSPATIVLLKLFFAIMYAILGGLFGLLLFRFRFRRQGYTLLTTNSFTMTVGCLYFLFLYFFLRVETIHTPRFALGLPQKKTFFSQPIIYTLEELFAPMQLAPVRQEQRRIPSRAAVAPQTQTNQQKTTTPQQTTYTLPQQSNTSSSMPTYAPPAQQTIRASHMATPIEIFTALNTHRQRNGRNALMWDTSLANYAQTRANTFASLKRLDNQEGFFTFINQKQHVALGFYSMGENSSYDYSADGLFDFAAFLLFLLFTFLKKDSHSTFTHLKRKLGAFTWRNTPLVLGFFIPFFLSCLYFFLQGTLPYYLDAAFRQNIDYVAVENELFIPHGLLLLKTASLIIFLGIVFLKRHLLSEKTLFILTWLALALFSAFFSQRPYIHYQLVILPGFCLAVGLIFSQQSVKTRFLHIGFIVAMLLLLNHNFEHWNRQRTVLYYQNFIAFMTNKKDTYAYQSFFDKNTPRDYAIASYIEQHSNVNDIVFLWGNSAQIYVLSNTLPPGRFTVAYHISNKKENMKETAEALQKKQPKYIIIMPDQQTIPFDLREYTYRITIDDTNIYEHI